MIDRNFDFAKDFAKREKVGDKLQKLIWKIEKFADNYTILRSKKFKKEKLSEKNFWNEELEEFSKILDDSKSFLYILYNSEISLEKWNFLLKEKNYIKKFEELKMKIKNNKK